MRKVLQRRATAKRRTGVATVSASWSDSEGWLSSEMTRGKRFRDLRRRSAAARLMGIEGRHHLPSDRARTGDAAHTALAGGLMVLMATHSLDHLPAGPGGLAERLRRPVSSRGR